MSGHLFEGNPVCEGTTRRGTDRLILGLGARGWSRPRTTPGIQGALGDLRLRPRKRRAAPGSGECARGCHFKLKRERAGERQGARDGLLGACPDCGANFPLQGRQGSRGCIPGSPGSFHAFNAGTAAGFRLSCSGSPRGRRREVWRPEVVRGQELEAGVGSRFVDRRGQRPGERRGSGGERGRGGGS